MPASLKLPPVIIHSFDNNDLVLCATIASRLGNHGAHFLLSELSRAELCSRKNLPVEVVCLGSRITYRVDGDVPKKCTLVLPFDVDQTPNSRSVLTPLGAALIGLRVGAHMPFLSSENVPSEVLVVGLDGPLREDENSKAALDRRLDQALDQTFPASDPVSVVCDACPPEFSNAEA